MKTNDKKSELLELPHEQQLEAFKEMLKGGGLRKVPIQEIVNFSPMLQRWMDFTMEQTDAPDEFLAAGGLQLIASVLGNQAYIMFGSTRIYPHLWMVLVAPSGFFRKTTALNLTRRALASMKLPVDWADQPKKKNPNEDKDQAKKIPKRILRSGAELLAPDRFSIDAITEELQHRPAMLMIQSEFGAFLQEIDKTYNQGAKETLTDIYDSGMFVKFNKTIKRENGGEPIKIDNTALSIFSATTKHWLEEYVKLSDIGAGFIARFLFIPVHNKTRSHGWPKSRNEETYKAIKKDVAALRKAVEGEFDVSSVMHIYELWYFDLEKRSKSEDATSDLIGFDTRLSVYALKFAIIMHASKYADTKLTIDSMISGIQLAEYFRNKTIELFETTFLSKFDKNVRRIAAFIYRHDHGRNLRQLQQRAGSWRIRSAEFKEIMELLQNEGDVHFDMNEKASISAASSFLKGVIQK